MYSWDTARTGVACIVLALAARLATVSVAQPNVSEAAWAIRIMCPIKINQFRLPGWEGGMAGPFGTLIHPRLIVLRKPLNLNHD